MSAVYLLVLLLPVISAQTFHWGPCPTPNVQANFSIEQYLGEWYEIEKLPDLIGRGICIKENLNMEENGIVQVLYSQVWDPQNYKDKRWFLEGTAVVSDPEEPAKARVNFWSFLPSTPYWVLSTDYTNYAVGYSCREIFDAFHFDFAWIFARTPTLPQELVDSIKQLLTSEGIDVSKMAPVDQSCED